jgi:arylsulfatase A-like enzyme
MMLSACSDLPAPPPNVLIYVVDTLRADSLGYENKLAETPHFDRFATESMVFEQARAPSSWTRPSFASILTGTYPESHGVYDRSSKLRDDALTLPEILREAGYTTGFITTNPNVGTFFGFDQGFDDVIQLYERRVAGSIDQHELIARSEAVTEHALEWIANAPRPFLLVLLTVDPHAPYRPPVELYESAFTRLGAVSSHKPTQSNSVEWQREMQERKSLAAYMGEVEANDRAFGLLMDSLRSWQIVDDTLVVVTSDHGEEFWEHGGRTHGNTLYDEVLRVPLLMRFPAGPGPHGGSRISSAVGSVDILPTVLESLALPVPAHIIGRSLFRAAESNASAGYASLHLDGLQLYSLTDLPWKLHLDRTTGEEALFDLVRDPQERSPIDIDTNLEARNAVERLRPRLARMILEEAKRTPIETSDLDLPDDVRATLEALGYLQDKREPKTR